MARNSLRDVAIVAMVWTIPGVVAPGNSAAADAPPSGPAVNLTINPDGSAVWNGEPLTSAPALKNKIARQAQQAPQLELDLRFHTVGDLSESNRQTLLEIIELSAQFGFVHVEATGDGAKLTVLGPNAAQAAVPK
jgi:hypothetical protein